MSRQYNIRIEGLSPLILHADNIPWRESIKKWQKDPANKKYSVAGDDRSPAWTWIGCLYHDDKRVGMPSDNLMTLIREGAKKCPTGKGNQSFKQMSQSGIIVDEFAWAIFVDGKEVPIAPVEKLINEMDFSQHEALAKELGFELFVKSARIGQAKHVRVRPLFRNWSISGTVTVLEELITTEVLTDIFSIAAAQVGLGDWRPGSPSAPGPYGRAKATVVEC